MPDTIVSHVPMKAVMTADDAITIQVGDVLLQCNPVDLVYIVSVAVRAWKEAKEYQPETA